MRAKSLLILFGIVFAAGFVIAHAAPQAVTVGALLDRYERGEFDAAVESAGALGDPAKAVDVIDRELPRWIRQRGEPSRSSHELVAASWGLETAASHANWPAFERARLITIACAVMRKGSSHDLDAAQTAWYRLSVAALAATDSVGPWTVINSYDGPGTRSFTQLRDAEGPGGHIAHAFAGISADDPQLRLMLAITEENATRFRAPFRFRFSDDDARPSAIEARKQRASQTPPPYLDSAFASWQENAMTTRLQVESFARLPAIEREFEALATDPTVGAEASLHLAEVRMRVGRDDDAAALLGSIPSRTNDGVLRFMAHLFAGWIASRHDNYEAAQAAYDAALRQFPGNRDASLLLATLEFVRGPAAVQEHAAAVLATSRANSGPENPWLQYFLGEGRHLDTYRQQLRTAISAIPR